MATSRINKSDRMYPFSMSVNIGAGAVVDVDLSAFVPNGKTIKGVIADYSNYPLPYFEGSGVLYVYSLASGNVVRLNNKGLGAWGTRTLKGYLIAD